jgi:hypothetical protein
MFKAILTLSGSSVSDFAGQIGRHQSSVQNVLSGARRSRFIEDRICERLGKPFAEVFGGQGTDAMNEGEKT